MEACFDQRYFTQASQLRWRVLENVGPTIERLVGEIVASPQIRLAIVPFGSTLKGYASRSSDIEFGISILGGLARESGMADDPLITDAPRRKAIYDSSAEVLESEGMEPESFGMDILSHIFNYQMLLSWAEDPRPITTYVNEQTVRFYASRLFLPTAYGDVDLLARARGRLARSLVREMVFRAETPHLSWRAIQHEFFSANFAIPWDDVAGRPHLRAWLRRQGVTKSLEGSFKAFCRKWQRATRLWSLQETLQRYPCR